MTLQEYLIKLGWSVDEPSFKKFASAVASTTARTAELSSAVIETAAAVELMVDKVARKYESLYYVGQRTGQSVKYIQSTQFAFKNIGLSAEDANASIERMGATLRTQPWLKAIFGNANTPQEVASRLGKSGLPYFLQARFAEMIGMDEQTLFHLQKFANVEAAAQETFARKQREAGLDPDELARKSTNFGRALNNLESSLEIFGDRIAADLIDPTTKAVKALDVAVQWISRVDNATKGWVGTLGALAGTAGGLLIFEKVIRRVLGLGGTTVTGKVSGLALRGLRGVGKGSWIAAAVEALEMVKTDDPEQKKALREQLGPLLYELGMSKSPDLTGGDPGNDKGYGNKNDRISKAVDALTKAGFPLASAQGIAAGLYSESGLKTNNPNPTSGANGIAQWLGSRSAEFQKQYLHPVGEGSFEEQLQFLIWELNNTEKATGNRLRQGGLTPRGAAGTFISGFERPGDAGYASDMRTAGPLADALSNQAAGQGNVDSSKTVTLNSNVTVNTPPGSDVMTTKRAFSDATNQANANAIRTLQGVVQ